MDSNDNNLKIENESIEKLKKYGNSNRNLVITSLLIAFIVVLVFAFALKKGITGITARYSVFYPDSTSIYIDAELNEKKISEFNNLTKLNIKSLPDLLSRLFPNSYKDRQKINSLMSEVFGDSFSYGIWSSKENDKLIESSLAIFPIKREKKVKPLFELLFGKESKLENHSLKGYKIITSPKTGIAFSVIGDKFYIADSYNSLAFIIQNYITNRSNSLYSKQNVKNAIKILEKDRLGTIIITNSDFGIAKLNQITAGNYYDEINEFQPLAKAIDVTAISILAGKNTIYFNSYTPYNFLKAKTKLFKKHFKTLGNSNFTPDFLPTNTIGFLAIRDFKDYISLMLELSGLKQTPEYDQIKQLIKMITSLDFDKEILEILSGNTIFTTLDIGNKQPMHVMLLSCTEKTDYVMSKLARLIPLQLSSAEISKATYKKIDINLISSPKLSQKLLYGKISPQLYAFGEKPAVEFLIDTITANKSNIANKDSYKSLILHSIDNPMLLMYIDIENLSKLDIKDTKIKDKILFDKISNNIKAALFTANINNNVIRGSLQLGLK